jgi:hypothetical protein
MSESIVPTIRFYGPPAGEPMPMLIGTTADPKALGTGEGITEALGNQSSTSEYCVSLVAAPISSTPPPEVQARMPAQLRVTSAHPYEVSETMGAIIGRQANMRTLAPELIKQALIASGERGKRQQQIQRFLGRLAFQPPTLIAVENALFGEHEEEKDTNSIFIITVPGRITPDCFDSATGLFVFPNQPSVMRVDPATGDKTPIGIDQTPFSETSMRFPHDDLTAYYGDRAVSVVELPSGLTLIGISEKVLFPTPDVVKTLTDRRRDKRDPLYADRRTAENMLDRLRESEIVRKKGGKYVYFTEVNGRLEEQVFDIQNPQAFLGSDRQAQVRGVQAALFSELLSIWENAD